MKDLKKEINEIDQKIAAHKKTSVDLLTQSVVRKCPWCGCYDGIHLANCSFILRYA